MLIGDVEVGAGTRVRLKPTRRADAHDLFYDGRLATVKGVFNDVDGAQHVAVALDDDPATDMHFFTDVIFGALLGGTSVVASAIVLRRAAERQGQELPDLESPHHHDVHEHPHDEELAAAPLS